MRRTLVVFGLVAPLSLFAAPWAVRADAVTTATSASHTATCALTSYTLTGSFSILSSSASFHLTATGGCVGTSTGVTVNLDFTSVGPWSCAGGVARAFQGTITPNNGFDQQVDANLVNIGGEYVIELHALNGTLAAGQFATLPIPCIAGQTQTTIGGTGTLTFTA